MFWIFPWASVSVNVPSPLSVNLIVRSYGWAQTIILQLHADIQGPANVVGFWALLYQSRITSTGWFVGAVVE